jgi:hypothetical protein
MHTLTGNVPFKWTPECQEAFDKLKTLITTAPILSIPNSHDQFHLECDTSEYTLGIRTWRCPITTPRQQMETYQFCIQSFHPHSTELQNL